MARESLFIIREERDVKPRPPLSEKERQKSRITRLDNLDLGDRFEIPTLTDIYRNLYVYSMSDCSITIKGEFRHDESEPFKPIPRGYTIAPSTPVKRI